MQGALIQVGHGRDPLIPIVVVLLRLTVGLGRILFGAEEWRNYDFCRRWQGKSVPTRKAPQWLGYRFFSGRGDKLAGVARVVFARKRLWTVADA
ncbi:MAG: hypothetical protein U1A62_25720 [Pseudomonas sp.]|nr:hypothetical protein [Pseudomonas sp.]